MKRVLLLLIPCFLILPTLILISPNSLSKIELAIILIVGILLIPITILLVVKSIYSKENIELHATTFFSKKYGEIKLTDIKKLKIETFKGLRIRLYLQNGMILGISPSNQFKTTASKEFMDFYNDLKIRLKN